MKIKEEPCNGCNSEKVYDHKKRIYSMYNYALALGEIVHHKG